MIFGRYINKVPKQNAGARVHDCSTPLAYTQGEGSMWKCWRCGQVWVYTGEYPWVTCRRLPT